MDDFLAGDVGGLMQSTGRTLAVAESCTGGGLGERLTSVPGSSSFFVGGIIAYSNEVKVGHLGVSERILQEDGAVSAACARAMAEGVRAGFESSYGLSLTGIAGPGGGTSAKPVGLVFVGLSFEGGGEVEKHVFTGGRQAVREQASSAALRLLGEHLEQEGARDDGKERA